MTVVPRIAREEWRHLWRDRASMLGLLLLLVLVAVAAFTAWDRRQAAAVERARHQARMDHEFSAQPDRHPHRMVHYGHFVFRPLSPLAAFDAGIDPYTGHTLFLEGHRQNSANFGDVRQSSLLLRFGQLTPAFVLQVLAPLLLIFVGHAAVARERQVGTLRVLLAQGLRSDQIVAGKLLALAGIGGLVLAPAVLALAWITSASQAPGGLALALILGYAAWLLLWVFVIVGVSTLASRGRDALIALLAAWAVSVMLVPRLAPEWATSSLALPTRFETDIVIARELAAMGDSHDPNDPYFNEFRRKTLAKHGVSRIEDLPVNYKGVLGMEGERLTSELFERHASASFELQEAQLRRVDAFSVLSPVIALRRLSMAATGSDLYGYRRFLEQAERHRYGLVQALNRLQAEKLTHAGDRSSRDSRIDMAHWRGLADFHFQPEPHGNTLRRIAPMAVVLLAWVVAAGALLLPAARRLGRVAR
ncbi:MAG: DUF3526 domain-containing protein [Rubrivivax sp.]